MADSKFKQVKVTPDIARFYLATSKGNRSTNGARVSEYARDMARGKWEEYNPGSVISFDKEGHLVDGHHRLMAVVRSGQAVGFLIAYTDAKVFDRGYGRSLSNVIQMQGYDKPYWKASVVAIARYHFNYQFNTTLPSDSEVIDFIDKNVDNLNAAYSASVSGSQKPLSKKAPIQYAAFLALSKGYDKDTIKEFFKIVNTGYATSDKDSPAITLRNQLLNDYNSKNNRSMNVREFCKYTQEALRDYSCGRARRHKYTGARKPYETGGDL